LPQTAPGGGAGQVSFIPLQSSSVLLPHISYEGYVAPTQILHEPPVHFWVPYEQIPISVVPHFLVSPDLQPQPSSMVPSQLSSTPLQISVFPGYADGFLSLQSRLQVVKPSPSSSYPSSIIPSQLLSMPSQSSLLPGYMALDSSLQSFPPHERDGMPSPSMSCTIQRFDT